MSTRSNIIVKLATGKWACIYCHNDGYPEHHAPILQQHYNSQEKAEKLIALGDLSCLRQFTTKPPGHSFETPVDGYCIAYGRDRGEEKTEATIDLALLGVWPGKKSWIEWVYLWDGTQWHTCRPGKVNARMFTHPEDDAA